MLLLSLVGELCLGPWAGWMTAAGGGKRKREKRTSRPGSSQLYLCILSPRSKAACLRDRTLTLCFVKTAPTSNMRLCFAHVSGCPVRLWRQAQAKKWGQMATVCQHLRSTYTKLVGCHPANATPCHLMFRITAAIRRLQLEADELAFLFAVLREKAKAARHGLKLQESLFMVIYLFCPSSSCVF